MTFCAAIRVRQGVVALADTRIVKGDQRLSKGKLLTVGHRDRPLFLMTSGLRSLRDKAALYFDEALRGAPDMTRLYHAANLFGAQLRRVRDEDGEALRDGRLTFNLHALIGGRFADDPAPTVFHVYPEGNWIEVADDSPYLMIGRTVYGAPLLDRLLRCDAALASAAGLAFLAFEATRRSVTDVGYPLDMLTLGTSDDELRQRRFDNTDLAATGDWWWQRLAEALADMPLGWTEPLLPPRDSQLLDRNLRRPADAGGDRPHVSDRSQQ